MLAARSFSVSDKTIKVNDPTSFVIVTAELFDIQNVKYVTRVGICENLKLKRVRIGVMLQLLHSALWLLAS